MKLYIITEDQLQEFENIPILNMFNINSKKAIINEVRKKQISSDCTMWWRANNKPHGVKNV
jgi:hypothetical protein